MSDTQAGQGEKMVSREFMIRRSWLVGFLVFLPTCTACFSLGRTTQRWEMEGEKAQPVVATPAKAVSTTQTQTPARPKPVVEPNEVSPPRQSVESDSLEYKLAVINHGGTIPVTDPQVARAKRLLDYISARVTETPEQVADMSVAGTQEAAKLGKTIKVLDLMELAQQALPYEATEMKVGYPSIVTIIVVTYE